MVQTDSWAHPGLYSMSSEGTFPRIKEAET